MAGLAPALELVDLDMRFDDIEPVLAGNICHRGVVFGDEVAGRGPLGRGGDRDQGRAAVVAERAPDRGPGDDRDFVRRSSPPTAPRSSPGQRIIAGSVVAPVAVVPGDALSVSFGSLGQLSVRFAS